MRISTIGFMIAAASLGNAQWVNYPSSKTPMTRDGKPNLASKAPRMHGKPDLSGVWQIEPHPDEIERLFEGKVDKQAEGDDPRQFSKYIVDLLIDYKGQPSPARAEALAIKEKRRETMDSPSSHCLPLGVPAVELIGFPFKIIQAHDTVVIFYENGGVFRQVHVDGRKLPDAPFPSWLGYSSGRWEGDTLVVDTIGFNDKGWMDAFGFPRSESLRLQERFHRRDFGHLDVTVVIDDPKTLTAPITIKFTELLLPNSDILEYFCAEGERDRAFMPTAIP